MDRADDVVAAVCDLQERTMTEPDLAGARVRRREAQPPEQRGQTIGRVIVGSGRLLGEAGTPRLARGAGALATVRGGVERGDQHLGECLIAPWSGRVHATDGTEV